MCRGSSLCLQRCKAKVKATLTQKSLRGPELNPLSFSQSLYVSVSVHYPLSHPASCFVCVCVCVLELQVCEEVIHTSMRVFGRYTQAQKVGITAWHRRNNSCLHTDQYRRLCSI